jgi:hypothetical protein
MSMPPSRSPAATAAVEGATRAAGAATPGTARRPRPMIAVRIVVWATISMGVLVKLSQHRKGGREVLMCHRLHKEGHIVTITHLDTRWEIVGVIDSIKDFETVSGMRRDRESGEDGVDREDGEELSRVKKSSFYSDSLILEHVPLLKCSAYRFIVSHVEAFEQVILLVG